MQNLINPRQYTPYSLLTPSGNLLFSQGIDFFNCYLLENITGNINITGSLKVNGQNVLSTSTTNTYGGTNVSIFNSINAFATGSSNSIVSSNVSRVSGSNNVIIGGLDNKIADADNSSLLGGKNVVLNHTGATILADGGESAKRSVERYSLTIDFDSGMFVQNNAYINGALYVTGGNTVLSNSNLYVSASNSGFFSGDMQVLGNAYQTGSPYQNLQNLKDASGALILLNSGTSGVLRHLVTGTSGALSTDYNSQISFTVKTTGAQSVTGIKDFRNGTLIESLTGQHGLFTGNFGLGLGRSVPTAHNSAGFSGQLSFDTRNFYVCTGANAWARIYITGW